MRRWVFTIALAPLLHAGCSHVDCGEGTIERNGTCVPADEVVGAAMCGPFTEQVGNVCVPQFPPTVCDDATTEANPDPSTGVITCIGTGGGGCSAPLACTAPAAGKQTICGQLYDFETGGAFAASGASGTRCTSTTTTGPCSLAIRAFDAIAFATNPQTAVPLDVGDVYVDDCGRYRLTDVTVPSGPFVGLGIDDADASRMGPTGTTNTIGIATPKSPGNPTPGIEAFVAPKSTTDKWAASGGPPISGGIYAMVFRANSTGSANNAGVTMTRAGSPVPANDYYFLAAQTTRADVDPDATATGANGTALITNASINDSLAYSGTGGLPATCRYSTHAGASLPFILFIQVVRPIHATGMTCPL
ncbi:MAG: hypothetical protein ACTHU0_07490 [Kofleriaceae bacterium]